MKSVQAHTREERNWSTLIVNEPLKVLLEDILSFHTKCRKECIKARLCGCRLITTIEQFHPSFTNSSNQIAVQINIGNIGARDNLRVCNFEISVLFDCSDDLLFDLSHGWKLCLHYRSTLDDTNFNSFRLAVLQYHKTRQDNSLDSHLGFVLQCKTLGIVDRQECKTASQSLVEIMSATV